MTNIQMLEKKMKEQGVSVAEMSKCLNINESTWYRKKKNSQSFSIGEAEKICQILCLDEAEANAIFFGKKLA